MRGYLIFILRKIIASSQYRRVPLLQKNICDVEKKTLACNNIDTDDKIMFFANIPRFWCSRIVHMHIFRTKKVFNQLVPGVH